MASQKEIIYQVRFKSELQNVKSSLSTLHKEIQSISNMKIGVDDGSIKEAQQNAMELGVILKNATNMDTGKLNIGKFAQQLQKSNKQLSNYANDFSKLGAQGQKAFLQLTSAIATAEAPLKRNNKLLQEFNVALMNTVRWKISTGLLDTFIGAIKSAIGYVKDLDKSLNDIRIVSGASAVEMEKFAKHANEAARKLSASTLEYTNAALIFYQQGLKGKEVEQRTDAVVKMAKVTGESAEQISSYMTAIWNNFATGSESLESYAEAITALGAATATSSEDIAKGLEKFAAVAETAGLSYEYAAAMVATVADKTQMSAETIGTAFKTIISRLQGLKLGETLEDGTDLNKYSKALATVGINVKQYNGELKKADQILDELGQKWTTLSKDQQMALAQTVAGVRQYTQLVSILENYDTFKLNVDIAAGAEGTLDSQLRIYEDSIEAANARMKTSVQKLYEELVPEDLIKGFYEAAGFLANVIAEVIDGMGGIGPVILPIFGMLASQYIPQMVSGTYNFINNLKQGFVTSEQIQKNFEEEAIALARKSGLISKDNTIFREQVRLTKELLELQHSETVMGDTLTKAQKERNAEKKKELQLQIDILEAQKQFQANNKNQIEALTVGVDENAEREKYLNKYNNEEEEETTKIHNKYNIQRKGIRSKNKLREISENEANDISTIHESYENKRNNIDNELKHDVNKRRKALFKIADSSYKLAGVKEIGVSNLSDKEGYNTEIDSKNVKKVASNTSRQMDRLKKFANKNQITMGNNDAAKEYAKSLAKVQERFKDINKLEKELASIEKTRGKHSKEYEDKQNEINQALEKSVDLVEEYNKNAAQVSKTIEENLETTLKNNEDAAKKLGVQDIDIEKLKQDNEREGSKEGATTEDDVTKAEKDIETANQDILDGKAEKAAAYGEAIAGVTQVLSGMSMAISSIQSLGSIWSDDDLSFGEKFVATITAASAAITGLTQITQGYNTVKEAINKVKLATQKIDKGQQVIDAINLGQQEQKEKNDKQENQNLTTKVAIKKKDNAETIKNTANIITNEAAEDVADADNPSDIISNIIKGITKSFGDGGLFGGAAGIAMGIAIAAIAGIVLGGAAISAAKQNNAEKAEEDYEAASKINEEVKNNQALNNEFQKNNKLLEESLKKGEDTTELKAEMAEQAKELANAYNIEGAAIAALTGDYTEFNNKLKQVQENENNRVISANTSAVSSFAKVIYDEDWLEDGWGGNGLGGNTFEGTRVSGLSGLENIIGNSKYFSKKGNIITVKAETDEDSVYMIVEMVRIKEEMERTYDSIYLQGDEFYQGIVEKLSQLGDENVQKAIEMSSAIENASLSNLLLTDPDLQNSDIENLSDFVAFKERFIAKAVELENVTEKEAEAFLANSVEYANWVEKFENINTLATSITGNKENSPKILDKLSELYDKYGDHIFKINIRIDQDGNLEYSEEILEQMLIQDRYNEIETQYHIVVKWDSEWEKVVSEGSGAIEEFFQKNKIPVNIQLQVLGMSPEEGGKFLKNYGTSQAIEGFVNNSIAKGENLTFQTAGDVAKEKMLQDNVTRAEEKEAIAEENLQNAEKEKKQPIDKLAKDFSVFTKPLGTGMTWGHFNNSDITQTFKNQSGEEYTGDEYDVLTQYGQYLDSQDPNHEIFKYLTDYIINEVTIDDLGESITDRTDNGLTMLKNTLTDNNNFTELLQYFGTNSNVWENDIPILGQLYMEGFSKITGDNFSLADFDPDTYDKFNNAVILAKGNTADAREEYEASKEAAASFLSIDDQQVLYSLTQQTTSLEELDYLWTNINKNCDQYLSKIKDLAKEEQDPYTASLMYQYEDLIQAGDMEEAEKVYGQIMARNLGNSYKNELENLRKDPAIKELYQKILSGNLTEEDYKILSGKFSQLFDEYISPEFLQKNWSKVIEMLSNPNINLGELHQLFNTFEIGSMSTDEFRQKIESLGITTKATNGSLEDMQDAVTNFNPKTDSISDLYDDLSEILGEAGAAKYLLEHFGDNIPEKIKTKWELEISVSRKQEWFGDWEDQNGILHSYDPELVKGLVTNEDYTIQTVTKEEVEAGNPYGEGAARYVLTDQGKQKLKNGADLTEEDDEDFNNHFTFDFNINTNDDKTSSSSKEEKSKVDYESVNLKSPVESAEYIDKTTKYNTQSGNLEDAIEAYQKAYIGEDGSGNLNTAAQKVKDNFNESFKQLTGFDIGTVGVDAISNPAEGSLLAIAQQQKPASMPGLGTFQILDPTTGKDLGSTIYNELLGGQYGEELVEFTTAEGKQAYVEQRVEEAIGAKTNWKNERTKQYEKDFAAATTEDQKTAITEAYEKDIADADNAISMYNQFKDLAVGEYQNYIDGSANWEEWTEEAKKIYEEYADFMVENGQTLVEEIERNNEVSNAQAEQILTLTERQTVEAEDWLENEKGIIQTQGQFAERQEAYQTKINNNMEEYLQAQENANGLEATRTVLIEQGLWTREHEQAYIDAQTQMLEKQNALYDEINAMLDDQLSTLEKINAEKEKGFELDTKAVELSESKIQDNVYSDEYAKTKRQNITKKEETAKAEWDWAQTFFASVKNLGTSTDEGTVKDFIKDKIENAETEAEKQQWEEIEKTITKEDGSLDLQSWNDTVHEAEVSAMDKETAYNNVLAEGISERLELIEKKYSGSESSVARREAENDRLDKNYENMVYSDAKAAGQLSIGSSRIAIATSKKITANSKFADELFLAGQQAGVDPNLLEEYDALYRQAILNNDDATMAEVREQYENWIRQNTTSQTIIDTLDESYNNILSAETEEIDAQNEYYSLQISLIQEKYEKEQQILDLKKKQLELDEKLLENSSIDLNSELYNDKIENSLQNLSILEEELSNAYEEYYAHQAVYQDTEEWHARNEELKIALYDAEMAKLEAIAAAYDILRQSIKAYNEEIEQEITKIDRLIKTVSTYQNIVEGFGERISLGDMLNDDLIKKLQDTNKAISIENLSIQKSRVDATKETLAAIDKELEGLDKSSEKYKNLYALREETAEKLAEQEQELLSNLHSTLEEIITYYEANITRIFKTMEDVFAGENFKNLDDLKTAYDRTLEFEKQYLSAEKQVYELSKMRRSINKEISNTTSELANQKLRDILEDINKIEADNLQMSEYDLQMLNAKYELYKAQIALEEAQNNKSQIRLQRNASGNWSYVFTADQGKIDEAAQRVENAQYNIYEQSQTYLKQIEGNIIALQQKWVEELQAIYMDSSLSMEEREAKINAINSHYASMLSVYGSEMQKVLGITGQSFEDTTLAMTYGFTSMEDISKVTLDAVKVGLEEAENEVSEYADSVDEAMDNAGLSMEGFADKIDELTDVSNENSAMKQFETLKTNIENYCGDMVSAVGTLISKLRELEDIDLSKLGEITGHTFPEKSGDTNPKNTKEENAETEKPKTDKQNSKPKLKFTIDDDINYAENIEKLFDDYQNSEITYTDFNTGELVSTKDMSIIDAAVAENQRRNLKIDVTDYSEKELEAAGIKQYTDDEIREAFLTGRLPQFDTGGYTGEWGSEGRLAVLHQKEIVLNKDDTQKILNAVEIARMIAGNALGQMGSLANAFSLASYQSNPQTLQQEVRIEATFPGVQSAFEIETALKNIVNDVSQYAEMPNKFN